LVSAYQVINSVDWLESQDYRWAGAGSFGKFGDGVLYATPSEFLRDLLRDLLREKKERLEAAAIRDGVLEGYRDLIAGRTVEFTGDLRSSLDEAKSSQSSTRCFRLALLLSGAKTRSCLRAL